MIVEPIPIAQELSGKNPFKINRLHYVCNFYALTIRTGFTAYGAPVLRSADVARRSGELAWRFELLVES